MPLTKLFFPLKNRRVLEDILKIMQGRNFHDVQERLSKRNIPSGIGVYFQGDHGAGKSAAVYQLAREAGRGVVIFDFSCLHGLRGELLASRLRSVFRAYRNMTGMPESFPVLVMDGPDKIFDPSLDGDSWESHFGKAYQVMLSELNRSGGIIFVLAARWPFRDRQMEKKILFRCDFNLPGKILRVQIWKSRLPFLALHEAKQLGNNYLFHGGMIDEITRKAERHIQSTGTAPLFYQIISWCDKAWIEINE